jgi:membrane associated rhomboid family serine protease
MPLGTLLLMGATLAVWAVVQGGGLSLDTLRQSICSYGVIPAEITGRAGGLASGPCALGGLTWEAVVTSVFLHGGWMHIAGNMWFLWIFGNNVEDAMGHGRFLGFYFAAGCVAAVFQILASPAALAPMVGASGAVSGVMGAYLILYPRARVDTLFFFFFFFRVIPLPAWVMLGYWMLLQLLASTLSPPDAGGGVAYMAHIGGFAAGLVLALPLRLRGGRARARRGGSLISVQRGARRW